MSTILYNEAKKYIDFEIAGKKVKIPYVLVKNKRWQFWKSSGKGAVEKIRKETRERAKNKGVALKLVSETEINRFMRRAGIGIDCSGFVYHLLDAFLKEKKGRSLANCLLRYSGLLGKLERSLLRLNRVRRISAHDLTSDLNTDKIETVSRILEGDLIRLTPMNWPGKHVGIVIEVAPEYLIYAHSSRDSRKQGPHFGKIEIINPSDGLEKQRWLELTKDGSNYGEQCFKVEAGDSVRRLKCLM